VSINFFGGPPAQQPPGYPPYQQPGYPPNYGRPAWAPSPGPTKTGSGRILAIFVGGLIAVAIIAGILIFLGRPASPVPPCAPAQPCAPIPSLPAVGATPRPGSTPVPNSTPRPGATPIAQATPGAPGATLPVSTPEDNSPPVVSGTLYTDQSLGYSFEYNPDAWTLGDTVAGSAVLNSQYFDAQVWVDAKTADTSTQQMIQNELGDVDNFLTARTADTDTYDALLGPEIGYVSGQGGVWSGTLVGQDGSPLAPGGVTIVSASDGRITVAVVVVVGTPDAQIQGDTQQHHVRTAADDILKTFQWPAQ
jgi:hypothetical protein